jgi:hypothetical protein
MMRWGILGCANIAKISVIPAIKAIEENQLIAVASRDELKAKEFAIQFNTEAIHGYEKLLSRNDIDAVYIPLPTGLHFEWVMKALEAGKHVLVEKSAAVSFEEASLMVEKSRNKKLAIVENFQFQYHSQHQFVLNLLEKDEIGEIRCFKSSFGFPPFSSDNNIRYIRTLGGGALYDAGAYVLKATTFILGNGFDVSSSFLHINKKYGIDWFGGAFLVNKNKQCFAELAFGFDNFYQCSYEIWGSKGKITSTRAFTAPTNHKPKILLEKPGSYEEIILKEDNHFIKLLRVFNKNIINNTLEEDRSKIIEQARLINSVLDKAF